MKEFILVAKALSDESRARILLALGGRELCVCQIVELLGLAGSTVSKHMSILRQAGLVATRKDGRWIYYRNAPRSASRTAAAGIAWLIGSTRESDLAARDRRRLEKILKLDREELCRRSGGS